MTYRSRMVTCTCLTFLSCVALVSGAPRERRSVPAPTYTPISGVVQEDVGVQAPSVVLQ